MSLPLEQESDQQRTGWGAAARPGARLLVLEAAVLVVAVAVFLVSVLPNLANHPAVTDDEVWVLSSAFKLAEEGVFGSDMFAGFYHADSHYYFNMPAHHFLVAGALKVLGAGILEARLVSVVYGLAVLLLTYILARKLYGVVVAVLAVGLLLFLRLNMGFDTGLPLQELSATIRYDLAPVPFALGGVLLLLGPPRLWRWALAGLLFGVATLLQFYAVFMVPVALVFLAIDRLPAREKLRLAGALVGATVLVGLPYGIYALANLDDFRGQVRTVDRRDDFLSPRFYVDNLLHETKRFTRPLGFKEVPRGEDPRLVEARFLNASEMLTRRPSAKLAVLVGLPASLVYIGWRAFRWRSRGDRLMFLCLLGLPLQFALLEGAKLYIYWVLVLPFLCAGIAAIARYLIERARDNRAWLAAAGAVAIVLLLFFAEGAVARRNGLQTASDESEYATVSRVLREFVPEGSRVVGSTSLWWALRDTDYRSYFLFFYLTRDDAGPYRQTIPEFMQSFDAEYLVLTRLAQEELEKHLSERDRRDLDDYVDSHGTPVGRVETKSYGYVDIWRLR